jgi:hypothetical protein
VISEIILRNSLGDILRTPLTPFCRSQRELIPCGACRQCLQLYKDLDQFRPVSLCGAYHRSSSERKPRPKSSAPDRSLRLPTIAEQTLASAGAAVLFEVPRSRDRRTKVEAPRYRSKNTVVVRGGMVKVPVGALYWLCFTTKSAIEFLKIGCNSRGIPA